MRPFATHAVRKAATAIIAIKIKLDMELTLQCRATPEFDWLWTATCRAVAVRRRICSFKSHRSRNFLVTCHSSPVTSFALASVMCQEDGQRAISQEIKHNPHNQPTARNSRLDCWQPIPQRSTSWSSAKSATEESQRLAGQSPDCDGGEQRKAVEDKSPPAALETARMPQSRRHLRKSRRDTRLKAMLSSAAQAPALSSDCDVPRQESTDDLAPPAADSRPK